MRKKLLQAQARALPPAWHGKEEIGGEERKGNVLMSSFQSHVFPPAKWTADSDFMSERLALVSYSG